jgi:hypothetical protein
LGDTGYFSTKPVTMSKIVIRRPPEWTNRLRKYKLSLDGENVGVISRNEIQEYPVTPGRHKLAASVDWLSSNEYDFDISEGETLYLRVSVSKMAGTWRRIGSITILLYILVLSKVFETEGTIWEKIFYGFLIVFALLLLYDLTLGRKKHLSIRPDNYK